MALETAIRWGRAVGSSLLSCDFSEVMMFAPVPPADPLYATFDFPTQMSNGEGVVVSRLGTGQLGQVILGYVDRNRGLDARFWAYRAESVEEIGEGQDTDFWRVDLTFDLQRFAAANALDATVLFREIAANVAESLLRWPLGRLNPTQASRIRVWSSEIAKDFEMNLPGEWRLSGG